MAFRIGEGAVIDAVIEPAAGTFLDVDQHGEECIGMPFALEHFEAMCDAERLLHYVAAVQAYAAGTLPTRSVYVLRAGRDFAVPSDDAGAASGGVPR